MQFYFGSWLHMRGAYPLRMEGQRLHVKIIINNNNKKCNLVNGGQAV